MFRAPLVTDTWFSKAGWRPNGRSVLREAAEVSDEAIRAEARFGEEVFRTRCG
jgi:hypothetical protein